MPPRKPRQPRPDELELWHKVVQHAQPMPSDRAVPAPKKHTPKIAAPGKPNPAQSPQKGARQPAALPVRSTQHGRGPSVTDHVKHYPVRMDHKRLRQMKKGRISPEARIDLHGMTLAEAHPALIRFILEAVANERRLVLVITGKGKVSHASGPIPDRHGVLRHQVPHWLNAMPLKPHVLQIAEAHVKHGGQGACYVYLRRGRG